MKTSKILLDEVKETKTCSFMKTKNNKDSVVYFYISNIFNLSNLCEDSLSAIERCFPMVVESNNFLELDFISIEKILSSGKLNIDSELQVFNAADSWLCHDITERTKYAKDLLSKVRLSLLSIHALRRILDSVSSIYHECIDIIEAVLVKNQQNKTICKITSRYCNQTNLNILV